MGSTLSNNSMDRSRRDGSNANNVRNNRGIIRNQSNRSRRDASNNNSSVGNSTSNRNDSKRMYKELVQGVKETLKKATQKHLNDADLMHVLLPPKEQKHKTIHKNLIQTQSAEYLKAIEALSEKAKEIIRDVEED